MTLLLPRRQFLGCAAGAAGSLLLSSSRPAWAAESWNFAGFNVGIQSYTLRHYKVDEAIKHVKDLGLNRVEFYGAHFSPNATPEQISEMKKKLGEVQISAHGVNGFNKNHDNNRKLFVFAKAAGIKNISADPTEDSFDSLDKLVKEFDIRVAIHNHGPGSRYDKIADVLKAIKDRDPRIGACADLGHFIRSAEDPIKAITLLEGRLFGIHLKDFADQKARAKGVLLGKGHLDVVGVFKALKKVNFPADGALSLEYEENEKNPLDDVKQCLKIAAEAAQKAVA